jgi:hypothetical protein
MASAEYQRPYCDYIFVRYSNDGKYRYKARLNATGKLKAFSYKGLGIKLS